MAPTASLEAPPLNVIEPSPTFGPQNAPLLALPDPAAAPANLPAMNGPRPVMNGPRPAMMPPGVNSAPPLAVPTYGSTQTIFGGSSAARPSRCTRCMSHGRASHSSRE